MNSIPSVGNPSRYEKRQLNYDCFVELASDDYIDVQMQYPLLGMEHAETKCFLRKEVYHRLQKAAKLLPEGYRLRVWDAWRPFDLQRELYGKYSQKILKEFEMDDCTNEQKKTLIKRFVSEPVLDKDNPPVHTTGGAVDVTIINENDKELSMGTAFDDFSDLTMTSAFEYEKNDEIRDNRRLLYNVMISSGFTNLPSEWWHYDFGDHFWAFYNNEYALYEGVFLRSELYE